MKNILNLLTLCACILLLSDCTPVRNTTFRKGNDNDNKIEVAKNEDYYKERFTDTTIIKMPDVVPEKVTLSKEIGDLFASALEDFDKKDFKSAKQKFNSIKNTVNDADSVSFEANFYIIECMVSENKLLESKKELETMLGDIRIHDSLLERVLVRLGQIHCAFKENKAAVQYFSRLADINPNSIYLKVANCDFLNPASK